uniref:Uncharacterized protein n=1 Tax=Arundo donax TaxID=35708 RepID=A0A0A8YJG5_ARUDO
MQKYHFQKLFPSSLFLIDVEVLSRLKRAWGC